MAETTRDIPDYQADVRAFHKALVPDQVADRPTMPTAKGVEVRATVARLLSEIARPRPMVAILDELDGYKLAEGEDPHSGQRVYAMSRSLYERLDRDLLMRRAKSIRDYAEVSYHSGGSLEVAVLPPTATPATPRPAPPDDMPELHTLPLEPRPIERGELIRQGWRDPADAQINVWSIIRSALSRAWAVADRPQVTSEVVARLDAIAADCEREVLTALLRTPRGEGKAVRLLGLAMERAELLCRDAGRAEWPLSDFSRDMLQARLDTVRDLIGDALTALRPEAQGEEDVGEVCYLCGEEFDPRESGTATGPLGQGDGVPRSCPRCARAYDAGYQQGLRRPRNDARQGEPRSAVEIYETTVNDSGTLAEN